MTCWLYESEFSVRLCDLLLLINWLSNLRYFAIWLNSCSSCMRLLHLRSAVEHKIVRLQALLDLWLKWKKVANIYRSNNSFRWVQLCERCPANSKPVSSARLRTNNCSSPFASTIANLGWVVWSVRWMRWVRAIRSSQPRRASNGCESGHWIDSVMDDGGIIKLEDGSLWEVDSIDRIDSMLWLPISNIVVCPYKLINTDDDETVGARRIRWVLTSPQILP